MIAERTPSHIRWMNSHDMPEVLRIETDSFAQPWNETGFLDCLRNRNCIGMVAERAGKVAGFMVYELLEFRLNVLNFAVATAHRRTGVGSQMIGRLIRKLSSHRRTRITVVVRESNLGAQLFFREREFRAAKVLRGYYGDTGEDGYLMRFQVEQGAANG